LKKSVFNNLVAVKRVAKTCCSPMHCLNFQPAQDRKFQRKYVIRAYFLQALPPLKSRFEPFVLL